MRYPFFNPKVLVWPPIILAFHTISIYSGLYWIIPHLDTPMHFLGGVSIALSTHYFVRYSKGVSLPALYRFLFIVAMTVFAAVAWEWAEFIGDAMLGTVFQPSIFDTMKDLLMGTLGAVIVAIATTGSKK